MGAWRLLVCLPLIAGCTKAGPKKLDGQIDIALGDCAPPETPFVVGPQPQAFKDADLTAQKEKDELYPTQSPAPDFTTGYIERASNIYGGLIGNEAGEMNGGFGFGRSGFGPGGGGTGWGTIGTGRYGTIGRGGTGSGYGIGGGGRPRNRNPNLPTVSIGQPNASGDLDKAIIRRYIKRNIQKITYCYEKQLLVSPKLGGTIQTNFVINPEGYVASAQASGVHTEVASCVAAVIKNIQFPKPKGGGIVQVAYPFTMRPTEDTTGTPDPKAKPAIDDTPPPAAKVVDEPPTVVDDNDAARRQAIEQARAAGIIGSSALQESGAFATLEPDRPHSDPMYAPGQTTPLRLLSKDLVECFRLQSVRNGAAVFDVGNGTLKVHGIKHEGFEKCVEKLGKKLANASPQRCSATFGALSVAEAPGLDISATEILVEGTKVSDTRSADSQEGKAWWELEQLFEWSRNHTSNVMTKVPAITRAGPLVVRAVPETSMKVLDKALHSVVAGGSDVVLAVQSGKEWKLLRPMQLPVVPVPIGTGGSFSGEPPGGFQAEETVGLSILLVKDKIWVGLSRVNEFQELKDMAALEKALAVHKASAFFADRTDLEIAGEGVTYGHVVEVITIAEKVGFKSWTLTSPIGLEARPTQ